MRATRPCGTRARLIGGSIRRKLVVSIALVHAILMTIFVFDLVERQHAFLHSQKIGSAESLATMLAANSDSWVLTGDVVGLGEVVQSESAYPALRFAMVLDRNGRVLAHTEADKVGRYLTDPTSRILLTAAQTTQRLATGAALIDVAAPILANGELLGWARIGLDGTDVIQSINAVTLNGVIYTILAIAVGMLCALLLARGLTRGIRGLIEVSRRIGEGKRDARADAQRRDELGELGSGMNDMLDAIVSSEEAFRESNRKLAAVIDASPIAIVCVDTERRVTVWNLSAERMFGRAGADMIGQVPDLVRDGGAEARFRRALAGETLRDIEVSYEDASGAQVELSIAAAPIHDPDGLVRGVAYALEDVRELRRLEATRLTMQRIFETSLDLILVVDRRGKLIQVSPSSVAILGYRPDEMIGHSAGEYLYPEDLDSTREEMRRSRRGQRTSFFECRYVHKEGRPVALTWTGIWSETEQRHFFIGRDTTERRKLERQLYQAQKMEALGQLTGGMSHDFNNLLGIIVGNLDILQAQLPQGGEAAEVLQEALDAALRGADLNKRLLAFARRQPLQPKCIDINEMVTATARMLSRTLGEQIEVMVSSAADLWPVIIDPVQLESALTNLAVNARDAMPKGGRLLIATHNGALDADYAEHHPDVAAGDYVVLEVTDTGCGMTPEVVTRVFEPFFTTKETGKGTGLGLSMVFGFVKQSGGHIQIYSEPGTGTTVRVYLPRAMQAEAAQLAASPGRRPLPSGTETVLVVEDNEAYRRVVIRQLNELGYVVRQAANAPEALEVLRANERVDLLFTDIMMPGGMNGWELAQAAGALRPELRTLFTSGFPKAALAEKGILPDGTVLLGKPYRKQDLAEKVREVLAA